jgi:hypothetical protein
MLALLLSALVTGILVVSAAQAPPAKAMSDDSIRQAILKRFAASKIGANGFQVEVKNGIATLRGQAGVAQHKGVATRLAKLAGAREVDNQITISPAAKQRMQEAFQKRRSTPSAAKTSTGRRQSPPPASSPTPPRASHSALDTPDTPDSSLRGAARTPEASTAPATEVNPEPAEDPRAPKFAVKPKAEAKRGEARSERRRY